jgi:hypothetical protein
MNEIPNDVAEQFQRLDEPARKKLLTWRDLAFEVASADPRIGDLTETLKWGQPSYLTEATKSGGTLRLGITGEGRSTLFVTCSSNLADQIRERYGDELDIEGNRAIIPREETSDDILRHVMAMVFTYKLK